MHMSFLQGRSVPRAQAAFSLVEVSLALGIATVAVGAVMTLAVYAARTFQATTNYADLDQKSRLAVDILTRDVRQARALTSFATNQLVFTDLNGLTFSYTWDPQAGTFTRVYNGQSSVLLTGCSYLTFHISQRTPSNNFTFWPASTVSNAKLIDMSWTCSRQILGQNLNSESIQTAKITIRN
jgi:Tfp pilus assembly protein PilW